MKKLAKKGQLGMIELKYFFVGLIIGLILGVLLVILINKGVIPIDIPFLK